MAVITRRLPDSTPTRRAALKAAKQKRTSSPIAADVLRASTIISLDSSQPAYEALCVALENAAVDAISANAVKDAAKADLHLYASHYLMVFNLAIRRGLIPAEERARYSLPVNSDALPPMDSEADLQQVAATIVTADAARVLAGGIAMAMPTAAEVSTRLTTFLTTLATASEKSDLLDTAQEELNNLAVEKDALILRIWDEVESYYNYEAPESKRANAREWGVIYVTVGTPTAVQLTVLQPGGAPAVGLDVSFPDAHVTRTTNALGQVELVTTLNGEVRVIVKTGPLPTNEFETTIEVTEGVAFTGTIQLP